METSKFKDNIPGFPGYHVTKEGLVYSTKSKYGLRPKAKLLTNRLSSNGYYRIGLYKDGKKYEKRVNRLVAETYLPNPDNLPQVGHIDNNPLNNNVDNLYWCTSKENCKDREDRYSIGDIQRYKNHTRLHREMVIKAASYLKNQGYSLKDIRIALRVSKTFIQLHRKDI